MRHKILAVLLSTGLLAVLLAGCNVTQLHERLIVQGIGLDYARGDYVVTMHVFDAVSAGQAAEGGSDEVTVLTAQGESVLDAFTALTQQTGHEPLFSQNLVLVLGEEVAKNGINAVMDFFVRYYEARPDVSMFVARGTAADIMNSKTDGKPIKSQQIQALAKANHLYPVSAGSDVMHVVSALQSETASPHINVIKKAKQGENDVLSADGTAVFHGDKMIGYLDRDETRGMTLLMGQESGGTEVLLIDGVGQVTVTMAGCKTKVDTKIENGLPAFTITVQAEANIYEIDRSFQEKMNTEVYGKMNEALRQKLTQECAEALQKTVLGKQSDVYQFGRRVLQADPEYYRSHVAKDWDTLMEEASYQVEVEVKLQRVGQEVNPVAYRSLLSSLGSKKWAFMACS